MNPPQPALPRQRLLAGLVDWLCALGWVVITASVGVLLFFVGIRPGMVGMNLLAAGFGVVPVCLGLAAFESGRRQASPGKRWQGLVVIGAEQGRITFGRGVLRNGVKVGIPWTLGHGVAIGLNSGASLTPAFVALLGLTYTVPICYLATLMFHPHHPLYDRLARTAVVKSRPQPTGP